MRQQHASQDLASLYIAYLAVHLMAQVGTLCINGDAAAAVQVNVFPDQASTHLRDLKNLWQTMVTKSLCDCCQCTLILSRICSHNILYRNPTAGKLNARTYLSARTVKPVC